MDLVQREHNKILAGIVVGHGKSGSLGVNYILSSNQVYKSKYTTASGDFPTTSGLFLSKMPVLLPVNSGFCFAKQWNSECCRPQRRYDITDDLSGIHCLLDRQ